MLCESTKHLLQTIIHSLESADQGEWDDQIELGNQCLYEMHQMTRPSYRAYKTSSSDKWPSHMPDAAGLNRAMPHLKLMIRAIRRQNRATALESGKAALDAMNGIAPARVSGLPGGAAAENIEPSNVVAIHETPARKRRVAAIGAAVQARLVS